MTRKTAQDLHRKWQIGLGEPLSCATGVYCRRWRVETPWVSVRLHHWTHSDDDRNQHDHPWSFVTFIIKGSYTDIGTTEQRCTPGHFYYRPASHHHWVRLDTPDAWTLVLTGPKVHNWGFLVKGQFVRSYEYFRKWGAHVCD